MQLYLINTDATTAVRAATALEALVEQELLLYQPPVASPMTGDLFVNDELVRWHVCACGSRFHDCVSYVRDGRIVLASCACQCDRDCVLLLVCASLCVRLLCFASSARTDAD